MKNIKTHISRLLLCVLIAALVLLPFAPKAEAANTAVQEARYGVVRVYSEWYYNANGETVGRAGTGTGFCVGSAESSVRYVVTNRHVTNGDSSLESYMTEQYVYVLADGEVYRARKVYPSDKYDLSIIELETPITSRKPLTLGSSDDVDVTDTVFAPGYPDISDVTDTDKNSITSGIEDITVPKGVVTRNHVTRDGVDHVQLDATISNGNSGGPLITENGYVIGVNSWMYISGTSGASAGYAIDIKYVKEMLDQYGISYMTPNSVTGGAGQPGASSAPSAPSASGSSDGSGLLIGLLVGGAALVAIGIVAAVALSKPKKELEPVPVAAAPSGWGASPAPQPVVQQSFASPSPVQRPAVGYPQPVEPAAAPGPGYGQASGVTVPAAGSGTIRVLVGNMRGANIPIRDGETLWIGKDANSCSVVFDPSFTHISRMHCSVTYNAQYDMYIVTDESTNGTYLENGTRLQRHERQTVAPGTALRLANDGNCIRLG